MKIAGILMMIAGAILIALALTSCVHIDRVCLAPVSANACPAAAPT